MMEIREVFSNQIEIYKRLILQGLVDDEDCFRISPKDEEMESFPTTDLSDSFTLGVFDKNELIGVASFKREGEKREKLKHKGLLFKIYISPNYRRQGLAGKLINEVINRAKLVEGIEQINLTVIPTNQHAKKLYEKFEFKTYAHEEKAVKWKGEYFNEDQMKLML